MDLFVLFHNILRIRQTVLYRYHKKTDSPMTQPLFICSKKGRLFEEDDYLREMPCANIFLEGRGVEEGWGWGVEKLFKDSYFSSEYGICLESYNILNNIIFT